LVGNAVDPEEEGADTAEPRDRILPQDWWSFVADVRKPLPVCRALRNRQIGLQRLFRNTDYRTNTDRRGDTDSLMIGQVIAGGGRD